MIFYIVGIFSVTIASCSQVLLKMGANKQYPAGIREYLNPFVISGYGMLGGSMLLTIVAYSHLNYLSVPVLEAIGYILVPVLSFFVFREKISLQKAIGILCILIGIGIYYLL